MMVCQCNGVSDRTVRRTVQAGASTVGQVARGCGAGASCGGCERAIRQIIRSEGQDPEVGNLPPIVSLPAAPQRPQTPRLDFSLLRRA